MKFYYTLLYSIFLLSCFKIQGAELPSNYRLEFTTGHAKIDYVEKRNFGFNSTSAQSDTGLHTFLEWKYFLIPPIMDISLSADYTDGRFSSTNPHGRFRMLDVKSKVGFLLPLIYERFGIKLVGEFHYLKNLNTNDQFSLNSTSAYKFYPEFIFYPTGFQTDISYSFYIPLPYK